MKIALETLGCKLNQADTDLIARQFVAAGHRLVSSVENADIYILNTCTVTHTADAKSRYLLRQAHRQNDRASLVVTGCYAQRLPEELRKIEGISLIIENNKKDDLPGLLETSGYLERPAFTTQGQITDYEDTSKTRSFIKIQDGCNRYCSFCIVPLVRGREVSLPATQIIADIKQRESSGTQELVLTGTEIGAYDDNGMDLKGLIKSILNETDVKRIRLSSLQPDEISKELISLWSNQRLCPHFHLSLQSGSDSVLKRMKRRYDTNDYLKTVSNIRKLLPKAAITTDIITGFPGETEVEFEESYQFCCSVGFSRIHVFPYSKRQGTEAVSLPNQVSSKVKKQRSQKFLALAKECSTNFNRGFSGMKMYVLWEQKSGAIWSGHTNNYIKIYTQSSEDISNKILPVNITEVMSDGMWGEIVGE